MEKIQYIFFFLFFISFDISADVIRLEDTDTGTAVINESITDYRKAWNKLKSLPYDKAFKILTATDYRGNNLLHLMARVRQSREAFAGEMLQLSVILIDDFNAHDIFEARNKQGLSPKEVAVKADNPLASEYLTTASNRAKKMRNINMDMSRIDQNSTVKAERLKAVPWDMTANHGMVGMFTLLNGMVFTLTGLGTSDVGTLLIGIPQIILGGAACRQTFQIFQEKNRSSGPKK